MKRYRANKEKRFLPAQSARAQRPQVLGRDGAWRQTAQEVARFCQQTPLDYRHPVYASLNFPPCLSMALQMCECSEQAEFNTCVVCLRAWYDLPHDYEFQKLVLGRRKLPVHWFNLEESEVLGSRKRKV